MHAVLSKADVRDRVVGGSGLEDHGRAVFADAKVARARICPQAIPEAGYVVLGGNESARHGLGTRGPSSRRRALSIDETSRESPVERVGLEAVPVTNEAENRGALVRHGGKVAVSEDAAPLRANTA